MGMGEIGGGRKLWGRGMIGSGETDRWWGGAELRCNDRGEMESRKIGKTVAHGN